jgi:HAD superfamily hydrolase (TIGR01509 family)
MIAPPFRPADVVFDLDGTLVDSEDAWGDAERRVVQQLGRPWDPVVRTMLLGKGPDDAAAALADFLGGVEVEEVDRLLLIEARDAFRAGLVARPGAAEMVRALRGRVPLAVATNSRRVLAGLALDAVGMTSCFDVVVCAEDVTEPKPAPDAYASACARMGADPRRTVALEDSPTGIASARAAGLWVVGCPSFADVPLPGAHVVVGSLSQIDAAGWLRLD